MEDQDPPIDGLLRGKALQQAIAFRTSFKDHFNDDADPRIVVAVAQKFYEFLKGDTK